MGSCDYMGRTSAEAPHTKGYQHEEVGAWRGSYIYSDVGDDEDADDGDAEDADDGDADDDGDDDDDDGD